MYFSFLDRCSCFHRKCFQEADNEDEDDLGGPAEKKIKLEPMNTVIKEEPIEPSQFDEQSSAHNTSDSTEQNSEVESRSIKTEETECMFLKLSLFLFLPLF